jgi:hypothetical protein
MTPGQTYDWAVIKILESSLSIVHSKETMTLEERCRYAQTLPDSNSKLYHFFLKEPSSDRSVFRSKPM